MKVPFNINLSGKTAIVTGGSGTLCSAMAYGLAVCGAKVAIIGRNKEKLASVSEKLTKDALDEYNKNVIVKGYSCNVINKDELSAAYETIKNELGSCDILINGAGGNQPGAITSIEMLKKEKKILTILSGILMKTESVMLWILITWELFFLFRYLLRIWLKKKWQYYQYCFCNFYSSSY